MLQRLESHMSGLGALRGFYVWVNSAVAASLLEIEAFITARGPMV